MTNDDLDDLPKIPTEPTGGAASAAATVAPSEPATPRERKTRTPRATRAPRSTSEPPTTTTRIDSATLTPDLSRHKRSVETSYYYWIGALPGCPTEHLDLHGVHFPKLTERVIRNGGDGQPQRIPLIGDVRKLTSADVKRMRDRLSRTVIRFRPGSTDDSAPAVDDQGKPVPKAVKLAGNGAGVSLGDRGNVERRRGNAVTIPTDEEVVARRKANLPTTTYSPSVYDEPAADYLFCVLCTDQVKGNRGDVYPQPLSETGFEWPGELDND